MKRLLIAVALLAGCAAPGTDQGPAPPRAGTGAGPTQAELNNAGKNMDDVVTYGMTYNHNRYSPLRQINKSNVKRLVPVWNLSLQNELGEQAQPLVYDGVMYVSNARWTYAIDAVTGKMIWRTAVNYEPDTPRVVCCGVSNKGVAIFEGKVFRTTLDAHVVALDQKTGKEVWKQKVAEWKEGYSLTVAPLIANGVLITGCSGAEFGARCFLDGWDPATGKKLWRRYTTAGPGEKGHETWEPRESYLRGGASTWITGSYDPELDLVYWGTGNAGAWNPAKRRGDNLYAATILAIRPKTGEIAWHYQFAPNDIWDWDSWENILGELRVNGQMRKVLDATAAQRLPLRARPHQRPAHLGATVRESELGDARRPQDRPSGGIRGIEEAARGRNDRDVARHTRREELAARGVQSEYRFVVCQHQYRLLDVPLHGVQGLYRRSTLPVHREHQLADHARDARRPHRSDRSDDRQSGVAQAAVWRDDCLRDARDRRWATLHREAYRGGHRGRRG